MKRGNINLNINIAVRNSAEVWLEENLDIGETTPW